MDIKSEWERQLMYTTQQLANQFSPWMPIINKFQQTGELDFTPIGSSWHSPQPISNNDCCIGSSEELKSVKTPEFTPPPNTAIKCYVCDHHVIKSEFALHLFFGALKCNDCQIKVLDCRSFRSDFFMSSNCTHKNLIWLENPIEYLKLQLNETLESDYKKVYRYVKRLKSLERLLPWKSVFQEYRRFKKLNSYSKTKCDPVCNAKKCEEKNINTIEMNCDEVLLLETYDLDQMEDAVEVIGLVDLEKFQESFTGDKSKSEIPILKPTVKVEHNIINKLDTSYIDDNSTTKLIENRNIKAENLLIQEKENKFKNSARAQSIKVAVENTFLKDNLINIKSEKEINPKQKQANKSENINKKLGNLTDIKHLKKKRKAKKKMIKIDKNIINEYMGVSVPNIIKESTEEISATGSEMKLLDLPEDGNYLVIRTPIEECPMCYTTLDINSCRINLKLLLYTFWCQCDLKIFFVPKTPANIEHPVKIIENV
ncbi:unnamed protein product [Meganyctiphanes norvegica]|uniref:LIM zinc-binding domain-containing protein n=1 Tax=Meganyctiphanes norvegica TaxID=48144 RepID=A0AAV2R6T0_MEGNR